MTLQSVHFPALGPLCCDECATPAARRLWNADTVRTAHQLRRAGVTDAAIARRVGMETWRVARLLGSAGVANDLTRLCVICGARAPREDMLACVYCAMAA
jgi:hypothetical protein